MMAFPEGPGGGHTKTMEKPVSSERNKGSEFLIAIGRPDLKERITDETPWSYWTMELYGEGIKGQGGLGILASDTVRVAKDVGLPMVCVTPFYTIEESQRIENFKQVIVEETVAPGDRGFELKEETSISTLSHNEISLQIYTKNTGSVQLIAVTEPEFGKLYQGKNNDDHRLYQEVALGFGGYKALKRLGIIPSMNQQLNEAPTVFAALARLDDRIDELKESNSAINPNEAFSIAFADVKSKSIYTNHTLEQAAEGEFSLDQFEHFVMPNIQNEVIKDWLREKINGKNGVIKLSTLAIELSTKRNGVSLLHAREAGKNYKDYVGNPIEFEGVTNGISDRWIDPSLIDLFEEQGIRDSFGMPAPDYEAKVDNLEAQSLIRIKAEAKQALREVLKSRVDQYGNSIAIPEDAKIFDWKRRIAAYKRPGKLFHDPHLLAQILESENIHLVLSGRAHSTDEGMINELGRILDVIDGNEVLKERVHFVQDYDPEISLALVKGADASINTPTIINPLTGERISTEACGTSWEKDIVNNTILISVEDGGVADLRIQAENEGRLDSFQPSYLQITGDKYEEEVASLYTQIQKAASIIDGKDPQYSWDQFVKRQLIAYLPIICGSRMEEQYINFGLPPTEIQTLVKAA